jgi:hypothetical protein
VPAAPTYRTGTVNASVSYSIMTGILGHDAGNPFPWAAGPRGVPFSDSTMRGIGIGAGVVLVATVGWETGLVAAVVETGVSAAEAVGEIPSILRYTAQLAQTGGWGPAIYVAAPGASGLVVNTAYALGGNDSVAPEFQGIGATGRVGEDALKELGGKPQAFFRTTSGGRYVDQLVDGVAHESKVGYASLTSDIRLQVAKDAELVATRQVAGYTWHFFRSPVTGRIGPSAPLRRALELAKIGVEVHE